ncbi:Retinoic acid induced 16-like protein-domain-containing protein [Leucosporidium creatinivorum]|uniref:Retinoic acid induced 16-like protein-domain-containing protein n=1 Tax=Leucosporidium creatinivorum TaxID=106004 RepID=A0A1Y2EQ76_9BASI|nr:Retinoic acid induced 16-like protein-domain-containing protein [Leucosporidium creatinivorum]
MSWLAKLASPGGRKVSSSPRAKAAAREDPFPAFVKTWELLQATLTSPDARLPLATSPIPRLLDQLLVHLSAGYSSASEPLGPCLEHLLKNAVLSTLVKLAVQDDPAGVRCEVIKWFGRAIVDLDESFLVHSAVNKPLVKLLRACVDEEGGLVRDEEEAVVSAMVTISERIKTYPELLSIFLREKPPSARSKDLAAGLAAGVPVPLTTISVTDEDGRPSSPTPSNASTVESSISLNSRSQGSSSGRRQKREHDFLLFAYLLRFVHREGRVGDDARAGLLSLVDIAMGSASPFSYGMTRSATSTTITPTSFAATPAREAALAFAEYLLDSDFADVLGAGLGALYGLLPTKLVVRAAGATSSSKEPPSWDDPIMSEGSGGMVLGGMGALGEEEDAEEVQRKQEDEEMRLRSLGVGISGTDDFREGLDGWLKLVEFTQEVLRRGLVVGEGGAFDDDEVDEETRQQRLITSALTSSILSSLRTLFLQTVLYPSILECSEGDGSAVAVMSYLDAMLEVIQEGTKLESAVLGFLMGEEESRTPTQRQRPSDNLNSPTPSTDGFLSPASKKVRRRKSSALLILESSAPQQSSDYYSALGRFSLKDLLVSNVHSTSQQTAMAALKLLHTMLVRHDRWSMGLLDVMLDEGATSFPIALRDEPEEDSDDESPFASQQNQDEDDDSDSDVFVYPTTPATPRAALPSSSTLTIKPSDTPARSRLLLGTPVPSTPSVKSHLDSLDTLLSLVASIDPSYRSARAMGSGSEMMSSGFPNYIHDAEAAMAADLGFRRGLSVPASAANETVEVSPQARRRSSLFGGPPALTARDFAAVKTMLRHKLVPHAKLVGLVLDSLSHFFSHSPDHNLALTAVAASLALCPYRSLEGWMLPPTKEVSQGNDLAALIGRDRRKAPASDDGDDRSVDCEVDAWSRHEALFSPPRSANPTSPTRDALADSDSLLAILSALSDSVSHYRNTIPNFDKYLSERRQGLFFVENLADALDLHDDGGNAFGDAVKGLGGGQVFEPEPPKPLPLPAKPPKSTGFGAFLSPRPSRPSHSRNSSTGSAFATPPRNSSRLSRSPSMDSLNQAAREGASLAPPSPTRAGGGKSGPASPFQAHYRQTGSISVKPVIVATPRSARKSVGGGEEDDDEDEGEREGPSDSPTKRLSPANPPPPSAPPSTSSPSAWSEGGSEAEGAQKKREVAVVTLSAILDNVIVLEEFIKELAGVVFVRRSLGVDGVRFV